MSILNRLIAHRHLTDAALAEIWALSMASGEAPFGNAAAAPNGSRRTAAHDHLDACGICRARYDAYCAWTDALRAEAVAEADAAFPADRLAAQQSHILRRLEALERPARVIAFPKFAQPVTAGRAVAYRWVAAAAAAGLIIGLGLGQWIDFSHRGSTMPPAAHTQLASSATPADGRLQTASATISDDALLSDLEASAALNPPVDPLRAIDTITPRSRDLLDQSRK